MKLQTSQNRVIETEDEEWRARFPAGDPTLSREYLRQVDEAGRIGGD